MDPIIGALIGGAASGLVGAGAAFGQQGWSQAFQKNEALKGRDFSANQAQLDREFNAQQAQLARDWSERMSSTAYQRQIQDMKKAGINPALMSGGAGLAAAPGGVSASAGGSTPSPTAANAYAPNAGMNFSSAMSSALSSTILANSKEYGDNLRYEMAKLKLYEKSQAQSALHADQDRKAKLAVEKVMQEKQRDLAEFLKSHPGYKVPGK